MVDVAGKVLGGFQAGAQYGILQQEREKKRAQEEAAQKKKERVQGYLKSLNGGPLAGSKAMRGLSMEDPELAKQMLGNEKMSSEMALERFGRNWDVVRAMEPAQFQENTQSLIATAVGAGVLDEESADGLSNLVAQDPERAAKVIDQIFDVHKNPTKPFEVTGPDGTPTLVQMNPETGELTPVEGYSPALGSSETIKTNPDGTIEIVRGKGGRNSGGMSKPTVNAAQKDVLEATKGLDRLESLGREMDTKFLEVGPRFTAQLTSLQEKFQNVPVASFVLGDVSPEDRKLLKEYAEFKSSSLNNLNLYIKDITGAAMSQAEAERIRKTMPDPGDGLFDGDSPTEFKAKYDRAVRELKLVRARAQYSLKNKSDWDSISLDSMTEILKKEQQRFYQEAGWSNDLSPEEKQEIVEAVKQRMTEEYGY